ncbi:hypothetical protein LTR08_008051 [Meristemomyces frigidus]|nr:hypothetical protein LTR08_008051 [Meristemomyces frigidus]
MEHSTAIMDDAGKTVDQAAKQAAPAPAIKNESRDTDNSNTTAGDQDNQADNDNRRKRKSDFPDARQRFGGKGGRNDGKRHQKGDMGRGEYFRGDPDKRTKSGDKRQQRELNGTTQSYGTQFSKEEIDAEGRKPKRKVAVLIGYSGTGYKGMQITPTERTIEGDLFQAFIKAGAISKANADDPKKASLVRCARTDKGVHAAGNMISLKLIVEDEDIVEKINEHLSPQIRVWGIERTIGSFSCYQACDSRWYEYLIPSHAFLPPHPSSWMAKKIEELADEAGDRQGYEARQAEVKGFWEKVEEEQIKPILAGIDEDIRWEVIKALQGEEEASAKTVEMDAEAQHTVKVGRSLGIKDESGKKEAKQEKTEEAVIILQEPAIKDESGKIQVKQEKTEEAVIIMQEPAITGAAADVKTEAIADKMVNSAVSPPATQPKAELNEEPTESTTQPETLAEPSTDIKPADTRPPAAQLSPEEADRQARLRAATKRLRNAYTTAKRHYRIPAARIARIQAALSKYVGTHNYHNFTIQKGYKDPSAKRHIKSFVVNTTPILIGGGGEGVAEQSEGEDKTEWLSMKVHGQSFMMHQIRKMVGMVTLLVRCGSELGTLELAMGEAKFSIPKVPGLGLLLERPVFDSYNDIQAAKYGRAKLDFGKFETALEEFKQREIYQRIFREEEERNEFGRFFAHVDNFKEWYFLFVTSGGLEATKGSGGRRRGVKEAEGSEDEGDGKVKDEGE